MLQRSRAPALVCLALVTALTALVPRSVPAPSPDGSLESGSPHYEEGPAVQVIPLAGAADTAAKTVPAKAAEPVLAECILSDGTIIRLCAPAEGLIDGVFLRPDGAWTRFARLEADAVENLSLTPARVLGAEGFLLRYAPAGGACRHDFCWFSGGALQTFSAGADPAALDLNGDGAEELAWGLSGRSPSFLCRGADGAVFAVTPADFLRPGAVLEAMEPEGPGPVRLIYRTAGPGGGSFCAVTLRDGALEIQRDIAYVPAAPAEAQAPPQPAGPLPWVSVAAPDGRVMDGAGEAVCRELQEMLWGGLAAVVPTDAPLDASTAYTVTFSDPETGERFSWSLDAAGVCRFDGTAGNCRLVRAGTGALPESCCALLELCCAASRTARNYDSQGRYLGWDLAAGAH